MADRLGFHGKVISEGDGSRAALGPIGRDNGDRELAKLVSKRDFLAIERVDCIGHAGFKGSTEGGSGLGGSAVFFVSLAQVSGETIGIKLRPFDFFRRRLGACASGQSAGCPAGPSPGRSSDCLIP